MQSAEKWRSSVLEQTKFSCACKALTLQGCMIICGIQETSLDEKKTCRIAGEEMNSRSLVTNLCSDVMQFIPK